MVPSLGFGLIEGLIGTPKEFKGVERSPRRVGGNANGNGKRMGRVLKLKGQVFLQTASQYPRLFGLSYREKYTELIPAVAGSEVAGTQGFPNGFG